MLLILCTLCLCIRWISSDTHSLQYYYTSMVGSVEFPEFVHVGVLDDVQITYFDSKIKEDISRQPWMDKALDNDYWRKETQRLINRHKLSMANVQIAIQRTNNTKTSMNYLQYTSGCQLRDDGTVVGVRQYAFNGEDLISFDFEHCVWITASPAAFTTRDKWNSDRPNNHYKKHYTKEICIEWMNKYLQYGAQTLTRKVVPDVTVYSRMAPHGQTLHCLATGFYPQTINVTWIRDGQSIPSHANSGILPNHDGTYQIKISLRMEPGERREHFCRVSHSSMLEELDVMWDRGSGVAWWFMVPVLIVGFVLVAVVCWICRQRGGKGSCYLCKGSDSNQSLHMKTKPGKGGRIEEEKMLPKSGI